MNYQWSAKNLHPESVNVVACRLSAQRGDNWTSVHSYIHTYVIVRGDNGYYSVYILSNYFQLVYASTPSQLQYLISPTANHISTDTSKKNEARCHILISADVQMRHQKLCAHCVLRAKLPSRTFFIVNTAFNMTSSGYLYSGFHNVTVLAKTGLGYVHYVDSSDKLSDLCQA